MRLKPRPKFTSLNEMFGKCSKLMIKTPKLRQWRHSEVFIDNFQQARHIVPVFPLLTLNS